MKARKIICLAFAVSMFASASLQAGWFNYCSKPKPTKLQRFKKAVKSRVKNISKKEVLAYGLGAAITAAIIYYCFCYKGNSVGNVLNNHVKKNKDRKLNEDLVEGHKVAMANLAEDKKQDLNFWIYDNLQKDKEFCKVEDEQGKAKLLTAKQKAEQTLKNYQAEQKKKREEFVKKLKEAKETLEEANRKLNRDARNSDLRALVKSETEIKPNRGNGEEGTPGKNPTGSTFILGSVLYVTKGNGAAIFKYDLDGQVEKVGDNVKKKQKFELETFSQKKVPTLKEIKIKKEEIEEEVEIQENEQE